MSGCRGTELRLTIRGKGFGTGTVGVTVYLGEDVRCRVLEVRPESIDVTLSIPPSVEPGVRTIVVGRRGSDPGTLEGAFTILGGTDLALGEPAGVVEGDRLVVRVPVRNVGCVASEPTILAGESPQVGRTIDMVPAIAAGGSYAAQLAFPLAPGRAAVTATVALTLDPEQKLAETDERNNGGSWTGDIPASAAPIAEPSVPNGRGEDRIWPWVVGGTVVLGAGVIALRRVIRDPKPPKPTPRLSWTVETGGLESRLHRPVTSRPLFVSVTMGPGTSTHTIVSKPKRAASGGVRRR